jgi:hypothetical protein
MRGIGICCGGRRRVGRASVRVWPCSLCSVRLRLPVLRLSRSRERERIPRTIERAAHGIRQFRLRQRLCGKHAASAAITQCLLVRNFFEPGKDLGFLLIAHIHARVPGFEASEDCCDVVVFLRWTGLDQWCHAASYIAYT